MKAMEKTLTDQSQDGQNTGNNQNSGDQIAQKVKYNGDVNIIQLLSNVGNRINNYASK